MLKKVGKELPPQKRRRQTIVGAKVEAYDRGVLDGALEILARDGYEVEEAVSRVYEDVLPGLDEDEVRQRVTRWYEAAAS